MTTLIGTVKLGNCGTTRYFWNPETQEIIEDSPAGIICVGYASTLELAMLDTDFINS